MHVGWAVYLVQIGFSAPVLLSLSTFLYVLLTVSLYCVLYISFCCDMY